MSRLYTQQKITSALVDKSDFCNGGGRWIRPRARGPRAGKHAPGMFSWTALSNPPTHKKFPNRGCGSGIFGGGRWIRTTEAITQQIYSLPPLATREFPHIHNMKLWSW